MPTSVMHTEHCKQPANQWHTQGTASITLPRAHLEGSAKNVCSYYYQYTERKETDFQGHIIDQFASVKARKLHLQFQSCVNRIDCHDLLIKLLAYSFYFQTPCHGHQIPQVHPCNNYRVILITFVYIFIITIEDAELCNRTIKRHKGECNKIINYAKILQ